MKQLDGAAAATDGRGVITFAFVRPSTAPTVPASDAGTCAAAEFAYTTLPFCRYDSIGVLKAAAACDTVPRAVTSNRFDATDTPVKPELVRYDATAWAWLTDGAYAAANAVGVNTVPARIPRSIAERFWMFNATATRSGVEDAAGPRSVAPTSFS